MPSWQTAAAPEEPTEGWGWARRGAYALHLLVAFVAGALLVALAAAAAGAASDGRVALLELRGLPIFVAGVVSVVLFALMQTSGTQARTRESQRPAIVAALIGFVVLIAASVLLYQPSVAARVQQRLERAIGVFADEDVAALESFGQDIGDWNRDSNSYRRIIGRFGASGPEAQDVGRFRASAKSAETDLAETVETMRAHAASAQNSELRDAMDDITAKFDDQLGGLRQISRGLLVENFRLFRSGDARFKEASEQARELFEERLRPLLERMGIDAEPFARAFPG